MGNTSSPALTASQAQMYLRAQMVSMHVLGVFLDFRDTIRKDRRLGRGAENARNPEQEEGGGRSPRAEWAATGLEEDQVQDGARESHPQFLPSLPISELSQGDGAGCMPRWYLKLTGEQTDSSCSTEMSWLP